MENQQITGGWAKFKTSISPSEMEFFKGVMPPGVNYEPLAVASQVVHGTNYEFFCNGQVMRPNPINRVYLVKIYVTIDGKAELDEIREIVH